MSILGKSILFLAVLVQFAYSDGVEASVSSAEVVEGNAVELQIKATGDDVAFPQIEEVGGVPVVATSMQSSSNFSYVNGSMQSQKSTLKSIGFVPKEDMTIPVIEVSINGKSYKTQPIAIKVVKSHAPALKKDALYAFELKSDKQEVSVGESFVVSLFISVSDQIQGAKVTDFVDPTMQGFFSKALGEPKQYHQNGYTVVEKEYLLTANTEGNFTIGAATAKLGEADTRRRDFFGRYATQWYDIASNPLAITVKPQSQKSDLVGDFTIDATVDATQIDANKPVNLTVKIEGKGNLEDLEFPKYEIDGVTVYSDEAKVESRVEGGELHSSYTKSFALISEADFTIPTRSFTVWNPSSKAMEKLEIASYDIKVKADAKALAATASHAPKEEAPVLAPTTTRAKTKTIQASAWWMLVAAFSLGMLTMYLGLRVLPHFANKKRAFKSDEALHILYPHINENSEVEEMVRKLYAKKNGDKTVVIDKKELKALLEKIQSKI